MKMRVRLGGQFAQVIKRKREYGMQSMDFESAHVNVLHRESSATGISDGCKEGTCKTTLSAAAVAWDRRQIGAISDFKSEHRPEVREFHIMSYRLTIISRSGGFLRLEIVGKYWQVYPPLPEVG